MRMKKPTTEFTVDAKWGKIALVSWGDPENPPILLTHGYMDTAATFIPLVEQLPDSYYYVAFDMPGLGKSDPFGSKILVSQISVVEVMRLIVKHMKWDKFIAISHSMGCNITIFYNHLFPGKITKMVHLDPAPPFSMYYYPHYRIDRWYEFAYDAYYNNYESYSQVENPRRLTFKAAVNTIVQNRNVTEEQAEILLSRSLISTGDGKFKYSWEPRMKKITAVPISEETFYTTITQHAPPSLVVESSENKINPIGKDFAKSILEKCQLTMPNFFSITITGGHDLHVTDPELIVPHLEKFLSTDFSQTVKSKL